jgi:hypothetical protein
MDKSCKLCIHKETSQCMAPCIECDDYKHFETWIKAGARVKIVNLVKNTVKIPSVQETLKQEGTIVDVKFDLVCEIKFDNGTKWYYPHLNLLRIKKENHLNSRAQCIKQSLLMCMQ